MNNIHFENTRQKHCKIYGECHHIKRGQHIAYNGLDGLNCTYFILLFMQIHGREKMKKKKKYNKHKPSHKKITLSHIYFQSQSLFSSFIFKVFGFSTYLAKNSKCGTRIRTHTNKCRVNKPLLSGFQFRFFSFFFFFAHGKKNVAQRTKSVNGEIFTIFRHIYKRYLWLFEILLYVCC